MTTRIVEWQLPYTWGTGIEIDWNKVISVMLREENNLILVNDDNELYTDLQLVDWIAPTDDFPVGVTVGKVLATDWWTQNGLLLNWKTTSWDYARWIYWANGEIYFDWGTGTWKQVYYSDEVDDLFTALRWELATVAFTWDYNDLINRPAFLQMQADWDQTDVNSPDYIKNKPTIPTVNDATLTIQKNGTGVATFTANSATNVTANIAVPNIQNNLTSTSTTDGLSAYQGKLLKDALDDLKAIGRFLSLWDASTGQPISFPLSTPYNYQTWDYFLVETVSSATPPVNYKPSGAQYTGTASSTVETDELEVWDLYIYDGTVWLLQINHWKSVSFANLAWQPSDNAALDSALGAKQDALTLPANPTSWNLVTWWTDNETLVDGWAVPVVPTNVSAFTNDSWYITSASLPWTATSSTAGTVKLASDTVQSESAQTVTSTAGRTYWVQFNSSNQMVVNVPRTDTDTTYTAWTWISILNGLDYSAMQWPCPEGFHVPSKDEWVALCGILTSTFGLTQNNTTMGTYLKMPMAGRRFSINSDAGNVGSYGRYWSYTPYDVGFAHNLSFDLYSINPQNYGYRAYGFSVRCFKNSITVPTSSWATLYQWTWSAWIFWNSTDWLISVSGDGTTWYTIQDKNLWATTVFNQWDSETDANCGYFFQWGNNYWFPHSWNVTTSSTQVDASTYWPWNYYNSSTFIIGSNDWSSVQNDNLWGATTWVVQFNNDITNTGVLSVNGQSGAVSVSEFTPWWTATTGYVVTKTADGYEWAAPSWWSEIVYATQAEYNALLPWAASDGKHYFIYISSTPPTPQYSTDITTATQDQSIQPRSFSNQRCIDVSPDWYHILMVEHQPYSNNVYEYILSTPFDLTSTITSHNAINRTETYINFAIYSDDWTKIYTWEASTEGQTSHIYQRTLSTPFDITTASAIQKTANIPWTALRWVWWMRFYDNGTKIIWTYRSCYIISATLSTAWDISTMSTPVIQTTHLQYGSYWQWFAISPDGKTCYMVSEYENDIAQVDSTTAYDFSNGTKTTRSVPAAHSFWIKVTDDGKYCFVATQDWTIYRYSFQEL